MSLLIRLCAVGLLTLKTAFVTYALTCSVRAESLNIGAVIQDNQEDFVFSGHCFNGDSYRLHAFQRVNDGQKLSYYEYAGPAGKGTVQVDTSPRAMAQRVCLKSAEIINRDYLKQ